jgi:hypothetical protein
VIYRREEDLHPNLVVEILVHATIEILGVVDCDLLWNFVATDGILPEEFLDGCGGYIGDGLRFNPLGEVFYHHDSKSVVSLCWCEFANDIDAHRYRGQDGAINYEGCAGDLER